MVLQQLSSLATTADKHLAIEGGGFTSYMGLDKLHTRSIDYRTTEVLLRDTWKVKPRKMQIQV